MMSAYPEGPLAGCPPVIGPVHAGPWVLLSSIGRSTPTPGHWSLSILRLGGPWTQSLVMPCIHPQESTLIVSATTDTGFWFVPTPPQAAGTLVPPLTSGTGQLNVPAR